MSLASRLIKAIFATEGGVLTAASSPAAADNSKKIATTEWAAFGFAILKSGNGYIKFPTWLGGLIIQWGSVATNNGAGTWTYPLPYPNGPLLVMVSQDGGNTANVVGGHPDPANMKTMAILGSSITSGVDNFFAFTIGH